MNNNISKLLLTALFFLNIAVLTVTQVSAIDNEIGIGGVRKCYDMHFPDGQQVNVLICQESGCQREWVYDPNDHIEC